MSKITEEIRKIIENTKPAIAMHGGDIEFLDYDDERKIVLVRLYGACEGCPLSEVTLKSGILEEIKEKFPEVIDIENVDD